MNYYSGSRAGIPSAAPELFMAPIGCQSWVLALNWRTWEGGNRHLWILLEEDRGKNIQKECLQLFPFAIRGVRIGIPKTHWKPESQPASKLDWMEPRPTIINWLFFAASDRDGSTPLPPPTVIPNLPLPLDIHHDRKSTIIHQKPESKWYKTWELPIVVFLLPVVLRLFVVGSCSCLLE